MRRERIGSPKRITIGRRGCWLAAVLLLGGAAALPAQQREQERRELEQRLRELQSEMRQLQRRLDSLSRESRITMSRLQPLTGVAVLAPFGRAYLGVTVNTRKNPAVDSIGAEISGVTPGGPADQAGLRAGDIIVSFNGEKLAGRYPAAGEYESEPGVKLIHFARELEDGDTVAVEYRRGNELRRATIVARRLESPAFFRVEVPGAEFQGILTRELAERAREAAERAREVVQRAGEVERGIVFTFGDRWYDMELVSLNPELGQYFGTREGLLVVRAPRDSELGLRSGDVILSIDGRKPSSPSHALRILRSYGPGETVRMEVMRQQRRQTLTVTLPERDRGAWYW
jgi:S1-C subfamily serine protease